MLALPKSKLDRLMKTSVLELVKEVDPGDLN
jgi:hypothetical protein